MITSQSSWQPAPAPAASPERAVVIAHVASIVDGLGERRLRVCIDGYTASGKSTFGHEIGAVISASGRQVLRSSLDDFKRPWSEAHLYDRTSGEGYYRNAYDYARCAELLLDPSGPSGSGAVALCSIDPITQVDHSTTTAAMQRNGVLIVDGVFALRLELDDYWDLRIWLDVDAQTSLARGTQRDAKLEGSDDAARALHQDRYHASEMIYVAECEPAARADVVIDNRSFERPLVLRAPE